MKKKMNGFCLLLVSLLMCFTSGAQQFSLSGARTMIPGLYAGIGYSHPTASEINLAGRVFVESAKLNRLNYGAAGLDVMAEYLTGRDPLENKFTLKAAAGATAQSESEPWIYKDRPFKQRLNYGLVAELGGMWNMTEAFALTFFAQQKLLFNKLLGSTHFIFGLTLAFRTGL